MDHPETGQPKMHWVGGWGTGPEHMSRQAEALWPGANHVFHAPTRDAITSIASGDWLVTWSLGSCRLMDLYCSGFRFAGKVLMLSPFLAFCSEYGMGGTCSLTQLKWLRRWLERDPLSALNDFYKRAGIPAEATVLPYPVAELVAGIDRLAAGPPPSAREAFSSGLPAGWHAVVGKRDPLLDAAVVTRTLPGCAIAADAGHSFGELAAAAKAIYAL